MEKEQISRSAGHTAVCKIENCAEKCLRIIHPREFVIEQWEIEHIHYPSEKECERSTRHCEFRPDESVEEAVDNIAHCSRCDHGETEEHACRSVRPAGKTSDPPAESAEEHYSEYGQESLSYETAECHAERHALIEHIVQLEPIPYDINGLAKTHFSLDENLNYLVDDDKKRSENKKFGSF